MHGQGLIEIKVLLYLPGTEMILEEIHSLEDIGLFDVGRPENPVPGPLLVDGPFGTGKLVHRNKFLVQKTILLQENVMLFTEREIHACYNFFPTVGLFRFEPCFIDDSLVVLGMTLLDQFEIFQGVFQTPLGDVVGVPIVIDVILVFVRSGYAQDDIFVFFRREA